ncbi:MAG: hypothetical protein QOH92_793 [Chloroflexota bacterium]|jgi:hypothetical protein|nr:hypothetical protein [Chloroflexota bacterium]
MNRRRLAALAGAIGLVGALFSSGVAARADTLPGVDSTLSSLMSTYLSSSQDACVGGTTTYPGGTKTCTISQTTPGDKHIAVCVQSNNPGSSQECDITQINDSGNNYALVFQHVVDNGGPTEDATQRSTINQSMVTAGTGSNFAAIVQVVKQSTKQAGDQSQMVHQFNTTDQTSTTGTNFASLNESSDQSGKSDSSMQFQFSEQDASDPNGHITQTSAGLSRAFATQSQLQNLTGTGVQTQTIDPRCCSTQGTNLNDEFTINQSTMQAGNPSATQNADSLGTCSTSGQCTVTQSSSNNKASFGPTTTCSATSCFSEVFCTSNGETGSCSTGDAPILGAPSALRTLATNGLTASVVRRSIATVSSVT